MRNYSQDSYDPFTAINHHSLGTFYDTATEYYFRTDVRLLYKSSTNNHNIKTAARDSEQSF